MVISSRAVMHSEPEVIRESAIPTSPSWTLTARQNVIEAFREFASVPAIAAILVAGFFLKESASKTALSGANPPTLSWSGFDGNLNAFL